MTTKSTPELIGDIGAFVFIWPIYAIGGMIDGLKKGWKEVVR